MDLLSLSPHPSLPRYLSSSLSPAYLSSSLPRYLTPLAIPPPSPALPHQHSLTSTPSPVLPQHAGIRKDSRSIDIGRGTKCRRPMSMERESWLDPLWVAGMWLLARRPARGRGGRGRALHIGHRFADDRCLWSEHPSGVHHRMDAGKSSSGGTPVHPTECRHSAERSWKSSQKRIPATSA